jgi:hypothetical protein
MKLTHTRTHTNYFDRDQVDELVGGAYKALPEEYYQRREYIDREHQVAADARLELLRVAWLVLRDPVP